MWEIRHPHYYTTYLEWGRTFDCPVYISFEDKEWLCRSAGSASGLRFIKETQQTIMPGVTALKLGGHFPGSLVLHYDDKLFIADTIVTVAVEFAISLEE